MKFTNTIFDYLDFNPTDSFLFSLNINGYPLFCILWNLFLVFLVFLIAFKLESYWQVTKFRTGKNKLVASILGLLWLIFLPNTIYLVSMVRHLMDFCPDNYYRVCIQSAWMVPFFFFYAVLGWLSFVALVKHMKNLLAKIYSDMIAKMYLLLIVPLSSLGVLLGLVNRWNSWEIFLHPVKISIDSLEYFTNNIFLLNWLAYTAIFYLLYFIGDKLFKIDFMFGKHRLIKK